VEGAVTGGAATAKKGGGGSPLGSGWRNKKATWASTGLAIGPNVKCNWADTVKREKEELGATKDWAECKIDQQERIEIFFEFLVAVWMN
jgi:hypothetical protein